MKIKSKEGGSGLDELLLLFCYFLLTPGNASRLRSFGITDLRLGPLGGGRRVTWRNHSPSLDLSWICPDLCSFTRISSLVSEAYLVFGNSNCG